MLEEVRRISLNERARRRRTHERTKVESAARPVTSASAETTDLTAEATEGDSQPSAAESHPWATTWTELDMRCPTCGIIHYAPICVFLNAEESPQLVQRLKSGHFNLKRCPLCRKVEFVDYPFTYYDPHRRLAVQVRPEWEWHAGGGEEWYAARLEDFFEQWAEHDVRIEVVFGPERLVERFLQDVPAPPARR